MLHGVLNVLVERPMNIFTNTQNLTSFFCRPEQAHEEESTNS